MENYTIVYCDGQMIRHKLLVEYKHVTTENIVEYLKANANWSDYLVFHGHIIPLYL